MTSKSVILGLAAALLGGAAMAQPGGPAPTTSICLDPAGRTLPVSCRSLSASRIDRREDICQCLHGGTQVTVPLCPAGVAAPAESAALEKARADAAKHGSLVGMTFEGRPICVAPHRAG